MNDAASGAERTTARILAARGIAPLAILLAEPVAEACRAQEPPAPSTEQRLDRLERENRELRERLETLESEAGEGRAGDEEPAARAPGLRIEYGDVGATIQFFGDVGFGWRNPEPEGLSHSSFAFGTAGLFATAQLGERFHLLSETLMKTRGGDTGIDQERLWGSYALDDRLYFKLGVDHSPISHFNRLYHHGKWLFTPVDRPLLARFEGEEGILPAHYAGLELGGAGGTALGRFDYLAVVSNGRAREVDRRQVLTDRNDAKALDFGLGLAPAGLEPLRFGAAVHLDKIPPNPADPAQPRPIREVIASLYADFRARGVEVLAEAAAIRHEDLGSDETFHHRAGYAQIGYRVGEVTPYARIDLRSMRAGDPFFAFRDRDLDRREHIFGVRYDLHANVATKVEVGLGKAERRNAADLVVHETVSSIAVQLAWVF